MLGALEILHVVGYLTPEPSKAYAELGLRGWGGYFATRSAPMGPVDAPLVTATFYVFSPVLVAKVLPAVWDLVTPQQMIEVRYRIVPQTLRALLGDLAEDATVRPALDLARTACEGLAPHGRPLYAAHAALGWPDDPLTALFHAATLLREHRGDGHNAALLQAGLDPVEALVLDGLFSDNTQFVRTTRGWTDEQWAAGHHRLRTRGLIVAGPGIDGSVTLTDEGLAVRKNLERVTDAAALAGWSHLGADGCRELQARVQPMRAAVLSSGVLPGWVAGRGR